VVFISFLGKEEKYQKRYLKFYIDLCIELKDFSAIEDLFQEITKRNLSNPIFEKEFSYLYAYYISHLTELEQQASTITTGEPEALLKEATRSLKQAYNTFVFKNLFVGDFNEAVSTLLIQSYRSFLKRSTKAESDMVTNVQLDDVLAICKKKWPKLTKGKGNKRSK